MQAKTLRTCTYHRPRINTPKLCDFELIRLSFRCQQILFSYCIYSFKRFAKRAHLFSSTIFCSKYVQFELSFFHCLILDWNTMELLESISVLLWINWMKDRSKTTFRTEGQNIRLLHHNKFKKNFWTFVNKKCSFILRAVTKETCLAWRLLFGDFLRLTFVVIFVNYFCLQNLLHIN